MVASVLTDSQQRFYESYFVVRQPVFMAKRKLWGHELLFRSATGAADGQGSASLAIVDGLPMMLEGLPAQCRIMFDMTREMLDSQSPLMLPKDRFVVTVGDGVREVEGLQDVLADLVAQGHVLALEYGGQPDLAPLLRLAGIVKIDFVRFQEEWQREDMVKRVQATAQAGIQLLAGNLESFDDYEMAREMGYVLFEGPFFQKPELVEGRSVDVHDQSRLQLLGALAADKDRKTLERIIMRDAALTYRLLKYVNSCVFPPHNPLTTVAQAITYMGLAVLQKWLMVAVVSKDLHNDMQLEVALLGTTRGYFFQWLAGRTGHDPDDAFMLGLFSSLEGLYNLPIAVLLEQIPLNGQVSTALCSNEGPLKDWIPMVAALECGQMEQAAALLGGLGVDDLRQASLNYQQAKALAQY